MATIQLTPGTSFALIPDGNPTFTFLGTGGNVIMTANVSTVSFTAPTTLAGIGVGNINTSTSTNGFTFNASINRTQIASRGFTFNQDGDVLTPTNKTRAVYTFTGADQTFLVPQGISWIYAKLWGAGGGAGRAGAWTYGADGGGGGHTRALIPVTAGTTIVIRVGSGGYTANNTTSYYGGGGTGGGSGDLNQYGGTGGGQCGLFTGSATFANTLAIAGGGGGGGSTVVSWYTLAFGGAGGGAQAQRGQALGSATTGGGGASQNAGGIGGVGNSSNSNPGTQLTGGNAGSNTWGGGGGGGYWGGGAGGHTNANLMGGGGGGSGFIISTAAMAQTYTGNYRNPAMFWDPDLMAGYTAASNQEMPGFGGINCNNVNGSGLLSGGHAVCVIYY